MSVFPYHISKWEQTVKDRSVILFVVPDNTRLGVTVKYALDANIEGSLQGIENRSANYTTLRLSMSWESSLYKESLWAFHDMFVDKAGYKFLVPLWPDLREHDIFEDTRRHVSDINFGWNTTKFEDMIVVDDGSIPDREFVCTGIMGHLEKPSLTYLTSEVATVTWSLIEDSPISAKISPNASYLGNWDFEHNWRENKTANFKDHITRQRVGNEREMSKDGFSDVKVDYSQMVTLVDSKISDFLSFYLQKQGVVVPWTFDSTLIL